MSVVNWQSAGLSLLFPNQCLYCGAPLWFQSPDLCDKCIEALEKVPSGYYSIYKSNIADPHFDSVLIAFSYSAIIQELFEKMKYQGQKELAKLAGKLAGQILGEHLSDVPVFIPVPLHIRKERQRGYNQASLIAHGLTSINDGAVLHAVSRIKNTVSQTTLDRDQRIDNMANVFRIRKKFKEDIKRARVLYLVDDVITTGATINELARTIRKITEAKIIALAVASPIIKDFY